MKDKVFEKMKEYEEDGLDTLILHLRKGVIKCGKYSHLVKLKKNYKVGKELFRNGNRN